MRISRATIVVALAAAGSVALAGTPAYAAADNTRLGTKLAREVTVNGVNRQLIALQRIGDQNGGTRASGTPGHVASSAYVHDTLARAGWNVRYQDFQFPFFRELSPAELQRISPDPKTFSTDEVGTFELSGAGDVTAAVQAVDVQVPPPATPGSTSGCEAADFAGFTPGNIALIQRGTCTFEIKAVNAAAAGASAVIVFNEGQPGRTDAIVGGLATPVPIPVVGISFAEGARFVELLRSGAPVTARVATDTESEIRTTRNVIAETTGGRADNVVFAGAHLDSVLAGPGINDNGTGSATLLELALRLADEKVKNKVRLAFWGAEESGLLGSRFYVNSLTFDQQLDIALYLNFDMIGSPNWGEFTYDGDDSDGEGAGPGPFGSAQIESLFNSYIGTVKGVPTEGTDFDGRSDYGPFIAVGIPSGGIFTGAEGEKTPAQAAKWGGTAGIAYDPCYHSACDTLGNVNRPILDKNADAVAFAVGRYALDTSDINGVGAAGAKAARTAKAAKAARSIQLHRATVVAGAA